MTSESQAWGPKKGSALSYVFRFFPNLLLVFDIFPSHLLVDFQILEEKKEFPIFDDGSSTAPSCPPILQQFLLAIRSSSPITARNLPAESMKNNLAILWTRCWYRSIYIWVSYVLPFVDEVLEYIESILIHLKCNRPTQRLAKIAFKAKDSLILCVSVANIFDLSTWSWDELLEQNQSLHLRELMSIAIAARNSLQKTWDLGRSPIRYSNKKVAPRTSVIEKLWEKVNHWRIAGI